MRIKRNYLAVIKGFVSWLFSRFKPLTVHTEAVMIDSVWEGVKNEVKKNNVSRWYVMTPANMGYFKSEFNVSFSKAKLSKILKERYKWMIKNGQKLGLHIHLSMITKNISYKEQENLFRESINWMKKELGIRPEEFVPGWWSYNDDTLALCKKYGLKMIYERDYDYTHDFDWAQKE